tara:strand:+ start:159 stop:962 length:804 start_codon:yes stop_codon:yes gene_type:complete
MTHVTINLKKKLKYRLDMTFMSDISDYKSMKKFLSKKIYYGNKEINISNLFNITGTDTSKVVIKSSMNYMDNIGVGLRNMEMIVYGNTGYSFGSNMQSGKLVLYGNCLDHAASGMKGGEIFIHGNTGDYLGGKPNSSNEGILDGFIYIKGNVGQNSIQRMRRGNIIINGDLGDNACEEMISGSVIVMGRVGSSFAYGIKRGTIITKEKKITKDYRLASKAEYNFIDFFINKISKILNFKLFSRKTIVSRYHGHKKNDNLSEIFLFKS